VRVAVFVPVAHFVLVPVLVVAGVVLAAVRLRERERLVRVHGTCPRCGGEQEFVLGSSLGRQASVDCPGCLNRLVVTTGGASAGA
jgi:ribosomal protein S27E